MKMTLFHSMSNQLLQGFKTPLLRGCLARTMAIKNKRRSHRSQCASEDPKGAENKLKEKNAKAEFDKKDKHSNSMWMNSDICKDVLPRFDDLYYKPSDMVKRKYTRTWNECPDLKTAPRKKRLDLTKN